jgi:ATP-binding cassette subfamily F protein 3
MLRLANLSKSYAQRMLFAGLNCSINARDRIALLGPNGSGKTTLLDIIAGGTLPDSGEIIRQTDLTTGYLRQDISPSSGERLLESVLLASSKLTATASRISAIQDLLSGEAPNEGLLHELGELQSAYEAAGGYDAEYEAKTILSGLGFRQTEFELPRGSCWSSPICCCWTSRRTTWISMPASGSKNTCWRTAGRYW